MYINSKQYLAWEGFDADARRPVGTGPYKFVEWSPNQQIVMEVFKDYWRPLPAFDREELPCAQDLSNWVLELPECVKVRSATPKPWELVHPDPNAQLDGIKWQTGSGFEAGYFTVKLRGCPPVEGTQVAAKGPDVAWGVIKGPGCPNDK